MGVTYLFICISKGNQGFDLDWVINIVNIKFKNIIFLGINVRVYIIRCMSHFFVSMCHKFWYTVNTSLLKNHVVSHFSPKLLHIYDHWTCFYHFWCSKCDFADFRYLTKSCLRIQPLLTDRPEVRFSGSRSCILSLYDIL